MTDFFLIYNFVVDPNSFSLADKMLIPLGGGLLLFYIYKKGIKKYKKVTIIASVLAIIVALSAAVIEYLEFQEIIGEIESGKTQQLVGKVENYKSIDINDHMSTESFSINGVKFFYSDYHKITGYHHACANGGVICENGQLLKLDYFEKDNINLIVKIYVPKGWKSKQLENNE